MRRLVAFVATSVTGLALSVLAATSASALPSGSITNNPDGTITVVWSGFTTPGNVWFCDVSVAAASCGAGNFLYAMGGWGISMPTSGSPISAGASVRVRATSSTGTLPNGSYNVALSDGALVASLSGGVIGSGAGPGPVGPGDVPPPLVQQFGMPSSGTCDAAASASLNWAGVASGGWSISWGEWMNGGRGGAVCTRTLVYDTRAAAWAVAA